MPQTFSFDEALGTNSRAFSFEEAVGSTIPVIEQERDPNSSAVPFWQRAMRSRTAENVLHVAQNLDPISAVTEAMSVGTPENRFKIPTLSSDNARSVVESFSPGGRAVEGSAGLGVQDFLSGLLSGLSSPHAAAGIASGKVSPMLPAMTFAPGMIADAPQAASDLYGSTNAQQQVGNLLRLGMDVGAPTGLSRSAFLNKPSVGSGLKPVDFRDIESVAAQERGYKITEGKKASQEAPQVIGQAELPPEAMRLFRPAPQIEQPVVVYRPPVEPSGGEVSFRGQGIPSAGQGAVMLPGKGMQTKAAFEKAQERRGETGAVFPTGEEGKPVKPEVVKLTESKMKNSFGDPMGTTYRALPEDFKAYQDVQSGLKGLKEKGISLASEEGFALFKENETIKNKYGGMPPEPPAEPSVTGKLYSAPGMMFDPEFYKGTAKGAKELATGAKEKVANTVRAYVEPLQEQVGRLGGPVGKKVSEESGQILARGKELYGSITPILDPAKKQVGKLARGGTTWMRELNKVDEGTAFNNFFGVNEGATKASLNATRGLKLAADANLEIGRMAEKANPNFKATGKLQRIPTTIGYDFIVKGGPARDKWVQGVAKLNEVPVAQVESFFNGWKEKLGDPTSDAASLDRINQDFTRRFPRTVTHVKTPTGWQEVVVADPFNYLEQAAQRTAHAVAFREVYPMIQHEGKFVDSGKLKATRDAVKKEFKSGSDIVKFDNLMRALQGHPLDTFRGDVTAAVGSVAGTVGSPLKALMLSANAPVNVGEVLVGAPAIFLGYRNMVPAMAKMVKDGNLYDQLELTGARNKAMYNYAIDPSSPVKSKSRIVASTIRTVTGQQFLNEVQEATAAASAKVFSDRIKAKEMGTYELNRARNVFRAMGFNKEQAASMVKGDTELLKQFENRAAAWLTGGNKTMAEMSRLGASRIFNAAFWFHNYPQTRMNQARAVLGNWLDDTNTWIKNPTRDNWTDVHHNSMLIGRQLGGVTTQGVITLGVLAGITGGIYGLVEQKEEAKDAPFKFAKDAFLSGFGGPLSVLNRMGQNVKGGDSLIKEMTALSAPANIASEFADMGFGVGKYAGKDTDEKIVTFLEGKAPATKAVRMGLAVAGLSNRDLEMDTALKSFYKWRREQPGFIPSTSAGGTEEQVELRSQMFKVKKSIEQGEDWVKELQNVTNIKGAANSLRAGTLLEVNSKPLSEEQLKALRSRIGEKLVTKLQTRDAMVREVARGLNEREESGERKMPATIAKPTGKFAVDVDTSTKRTERVMAKLSLPVKQFLTNAEVTSLDYTPTIPSEASNKQLTVEEAKTMESAFVSALEELVGDLIKDGGIRTNNLAIRKNITQRMVQGARKMALASALEQDEKAKAQKR